MTLILNKIVLVLLLKKNEVILLKFFFTCQSAWENCEARLWMQV